MGKALLMLLFVVSACVASRNPAIERSARPGRKSLGSGEACVTRYVPPACSGASLSYGASDAGVRVNSFDGGWVVCWMHPEQVVHTIVLCDFRGGDSIDIGRVEAPPEPRSDGCP